MPLDIDRHAHVGSSLQRWDPRFKILALSVFLFSVALLKTLPVMGIALAVAVIFFVLSSLPAAFVAQGAGWVSVFLIPFVLILPFSYPGGVVAFHLWGLSFAWEGLRLAVLIFGKALAIVVTAYVMFGSSRFDVSMIALQRLRCPKIIVQMLLFTYRYIFVFVSEMRRMETSMRARGFVKKADMRTLHVMGNFVGTLLVRSLERTERIYKAMLSKGYQGELHSLVTFSATGRDVLKAGCVLAVTVVILVADFSGAFALAEKGWF